jgi:hypothetical protein
MMKQTSIITLLASFLFFVAAESAMAQSTIFNVPTTDTVSKGKAYFEFDFLPQIPKADGANRTYIYDPRLVVGVGPNVEAGVNVASVHISPKTSVFPQPNIKWRFFSDDMEGLAAAGGGILYIPVNHRDGVPTYGLIYGEFSKKIKTGMYGPRFHAGPYGIVHGGSRWIGPKAGAILGYEQPIHPRVSIVADWFSGKNGFGYFTPGLSFTLPANGIFNAGYSLGNDSYSGNNNRFLFVYYGVTF